MFRFVHLADVHLDTIFRARDPERRERLRRSGEQALVAAVDLALSRRVQAVLIAGDLLDGARRSHHSEVLLVRELRRLLQQGVVPCIAAGNHDPGSFLGAFPWPEGVELFLDATPRTVMIRDPRTGEPRATVTGAGHPGEAVGTNLAAAFPVLEPGLPHVALLHAHVEGIEAAARHDRYAPCSARDLSARPFDYWALGHIHLRQSVPGPPHAWYPGNLQGRHARESGSKGALLVEVDPASGTRVEYVPLAELRFETLALADLQQVTDEGGLLARIRSALAARRRDDPGLGERHRWCLRVELRGPSKLARTMPSWSSFEARRELEDELQSALGVVTVELRTEGLRAPVDVATCRRQPHVLGQALREVEALRRGESPRWLDSLRFASTASEEGRLALIERLLPGLEEELIERMQQDEAG